MRWAFVRSRPCRLIATAVPIHCCGCGGRDLTEELRGTLWHWMLTGVSPSLDRLTSHGGSVRSLRSNPLRQTADLSSPISVMLPVHPCAKKYSAFAAGQISGISRAVPRHQKGRFAIVTNVGAGCGGRLGAFDEWHMRRTAKSRGPDAPTLASTRRRCFGIAPGMVARKPGHQGEREGNR